MLCSSITALSFGRSLFIMKIHLWDRTRGVRRGCGGGKEFEKVQISATEGMVSRSADLLAMEDAIVLTTNSKCGDGKVEVAHYGMGIVPLCAMFIFMSHGRG